MCAVLATSAGETPGTDGGALDGCADGLDLRAGAELADGDGVRGSVTVGLGALLADVAAGEGVGAPDPLEALFEEQPAPKPSNPTVSTPAINRPRIV